MIEREMEDLLAAYPDDFFPRYGFRLQGRQDSFHGVGRFDLLFVDRNGMNILVELKAVPAKYDVVDQIAKYRDALSIKGIVNVLMFIVAPSIPATLRLFLDHLGIEYAEIHPAEYRRVAALRGYRFEDATAKLTERKPDNRERKRTLDQGHKSGAQIERAGTETGRDLWGFGKGTQPSFLIRALEAGDKTKEQIRSEFIAHFFPDLGFADAKSKSGFRVFFSDSIKPIGTYHASRALLIRKDAGGLLSLDAERSALVKAAISAGILKRVRAVDSKKDKVRFDLILEEFGLPAEPYRERLQRRVARATSTP